MAVLHVERVREVVEAGLAVHGHAERAHAANDIDLFGGGDVNDVQGTARDAADLAGRLASHETGDVGSALSPGRQVGSAFALEALLEESADVGVLGVDHGQDVCTVASQRRQPFEAVVEHAVVGEPDRDLIGRGVLARLVRGVEVLEPDDATLGELFLLVEVAVGLHDRVQREVAVGDLLGPGDLLLEPRDMVVAHRNRRAALEADDRRDALVGSAAALALPGGAEPVNGGIRGANTDMGVRVDQPRQDPVAVGIDGVRVVRQRPVRADSGDHAVLGVDATTQDPRWGDDVAVLDHQAHGVAPSSPP